MGERIVSCMNASLPEPSPAAGLSRFQSVILGTLAFTAVSTLAFAVWAFGGGWFRGRGGEPAMYAVIAVVFMGLTGAFLHPLLTGTRRLLRFYGVFVPAFLAYAIVWSGFWFWLGSGAGEWLGAIVGSAAFIGISAWRLGQWNSLFLAGLVFFVTHTAGYFAGGRSMAHFIGIGRAESAGSAARDRWFLIAKLSWGIGYGLGFGAGLGYAYYSLQTRRSIIQTAGTNPSNGPHDIAR